MKPKADGWRHNGSPCSNRNNWKFEPLGANTTADFVGCLMVFWEVDGGSFGIFVGASWVNWGVWSLEINQS